MASHIRKHKFVVATHEEFGSIGLKMRGKSWMEPFGATAVAHDILEHMPDDDGSVEHELAALGAGIFVRNEGEVYVAHGQLETNPAVNIASEMPQQCYYMHASGRNSLRVPPRHRKQEEWVETIFAETWQKSRRLCRAEFDECDLGITTWLEDRNRFTGWLRHGYVRAVRKYKPASASELADLFLRIEREAARILRFPFEGQEFEFCVDTYRGTVRVTTAEEDY